MVNNVVRLTSLIACFLLAFVASIQLDVMESSVPVGTQYNVYLAVTGSKVSKPEAVKALDSITDQYGLKIEKIVPDPEDYLHGRSLYRFGIAKPVTPGSLTWYDPSWHGQLLPSSSIGPASLDGQYAVSGSAAGLTALEDWAKSSDVRSVFLPRPSWIEMTFSAIAFSGSYAIIVAVLFLFLAAIMTWYAARSRAKTLKILAGASTRRIESEELSRLALLLVVPATIVLIASTLIVGIRSGFSYVGPFLETFLPLVALGVVFALIVSVCVSVFSWPSVEQIASRLSPLRKFRTISEVVKVMTLICAMVFIPLAVSTIGTSLNATQTAGRWTDLKDQFNINNFGTRPGSVEDENSVVNFKKLVTEADQSGLLTIGFRQAALSKPGQGPASTGEFDGIFYANPKYLELNHISLTPQAQQPYLEKIDVRSIPVEIQEDYAPTIELQLQQTEPLNTQTWSPFEVYRYHGKDGFPAITVNGSPTIETLRNPLILLIRTPGTTMSGEFLQAATSQDGVLFSDHEKLTSLLIKHDLASGVTSIDRAADSGLVMLQYQTRTLYLQLGAAVILLVALIFSSWLAASTWAISRVRHLVPMRVSGLSWQAILRKRILWEIILACALTVAAFSIMAAAQVPAAIWWTLTVPLGYGLITTMLHVGEVRRVFNQTVRRRA